MIGILDQQQSQKHFLGVISSKNSKQFFLRIGVARGGLLEAGLNYISKEGRKANFKVLEGSIWDCPPF